MMSALSTNSAAASYSSSSLPRVILLLDLDCFYAACERVRLKLPHETTSLALLQWNSVLAVTYPARTQYGIKRGDTWDQVFQKSSKQCMALHLPLLQVKQQQSTNTTDTTAPIRTAGTSTSSENHPHAPPLLALMADESMEQAYEREFHLNDAQRQHIYTHELNVRRHNHEGKACLERYRIASSRIFGVVLQTLREQLGDGNFILERASIDELFLDVTQCCWEKSSATNGDSRIQDSDVESAMAQTVLVGGDGGERKENRHQLSGDEDENNENDPTVLRALAHGCRIAHTIRQSVFDKLGFTLSAGISTSKLLAKLGASYGKPNGQAIIRPSHVQHVMSATPISKVRHLGGKIGKLVQALLPPNEPHTMSSIARFLSLPMLTDKLGEDTGRMVFEACRGLDREVVRHTVGALVKSITAFKSFQKTSVTSVDMSEWLALLATEIVSRVRIDSHRNERYPRSCTVQYTMPNENRGASRRSNQVKSLRIPFPSDNNKSEENTATKLVDKSKDLIIAKEGGGQVWLVGVGFCANDFQPRVRNGGISSYFSERGKEGDDLIVKSILRSNNGDEPATEALDGVARSTHNDSRSTPIDAQAHETSDVSRQPPPSNAAVVDKDLEMARKLQASYDRENALVTAAERRAQPAKKARIDSFFTVKRNVS